MTLEAERKAGEAAELVMFLGGQLKKRPFQTAGWEFLQMVVVIVRESYPKMA